MGKWILQYITYVSALLSQVTASRVKNTELHLQAQGDLLPLLFVFNHQKYSRYLTTNHTELTNLPSKNPSAYKDLQIYSIGASLSSKNFSTIPGDLVTNVTINRELKVHGGPTTGGYKISFDAENDFVLNSHPAGIYLFKVNNRNTRTRCEICSKLTIKTPELLLTIVNFEHISHLVLVFLLLTLNM